MPYTSEYMLLLLLSLKHTDSSFFLTKHLSPLVIGELCNEALLKNYIIEDNRSFKLTESGELFIKNTNKQLNRQGIDQCIAPIPDVRINKISLSDIYLPNKL